jgi:hypothetical protein
VCDPETGPSLALHCNHSMELQSTDTPLGCCKSPCEVGASARHCLSWLRISLGLLGGANKSLWWCGWVGDTSVRKQGGWNVLMVAREATRVDAWTFTPTKHVQDHQGMDGLQGLMSCRGSARVLQPAFSQGTFWKGNQYLSTVLVKYPGLSHIP